MPKFELIQGGKPDGLPIPSENDPVAEEREWIETIKAIFSSDPDRMAYVGKFMRLPRHRRKVIVYHIREDDNLRGAKQLIDAPIREMENE